MTHIVGDHIPDILAEYVRNRTTLIPVIFGSGYNTVRINDKLLVKRSAIAVQADIIAAVTLRDDNHLHHLTVLGMIQCVNIGIKSLCVR